MERGTGSNGISLINRESNHYFGSHADDAPDMDTVLWAAQHMDAVLNVVQRNMIVFGIWLVGGFVLEKAVGVKADAVVADRAAKAVRIFPHLDFNRAGVGEVLESVHNAVFNNRLDG